MTDNTMAAIVFLGAFLGIGFLAFQAKECNMADNALGPTRIAACKAACSPGTVREVTASGVCTCD